MEVVLVKGNGVLHLHRAGRDPHVDSELLQGCHELVVEVGYRAREQEQGARGAVVEADIQAVVDQVEVDLEDAAAEGDGGGGQAPCCHHEAHVPPFVEEGHELQLNLADDLGPHV
jgi:hypothetical protein